jgi:hypothetical protein
VSSLTGIFKPEPEETQDNDKLVDLFRNRSELKMEFAALRDEKYQLQDRVKQHQGATARVQQKMDHLENLLLDRKWVHIVVTFYQLRRLSAHCNAKLARFAEELKQQREQRLQGKVVDAWSEERDERVNYLQTQLSEERLQTQLFEDRLLAERKRLTTMGSVEKMLRGKALAAEIEELQLRVNAAKRKASESQYSLENVLNLSPPEHEGLDVATKRSINLMILAFAQQLYLHFEEDNLAAMAKEASEKSVGAINYGTKAECDVIIARIEKRWDSMGNVASYAEVLQKRAKFIADNAIYRDADEAVPITGTAATVFQIDENGVVKKKDANIIGDNYFGISKVLSR